MRTKIHQDTIDCAKRCGRHWCEQYVRDCGYDFDEARAVERAHGIKTSHNLCLSCGHSIDAHDRQYGCAEDGCDC